MSLAERLRQRRSRDYPSLAEALAEAVDGSAESVFTWSTAQPSVAVDALDSERADPLTEMLRTQLEEAPLPGLPELRAAAAMVSEGLARRVVLSGFESWPGLLTEMERLAERYRLCIVPQIGGPGGRVDLVVTPEQSRAQ